MTRWLAKARKKEREWIISNSSVVLCTMISMFACPKDLNLMTKALSVGCFFQMKHIITCTFPCFLSSLIFPLCFHCTFPTLNILFVFCVFIISISLSSLFKASFKFFAPILLLFHANSEIVWTYWTFLCAWRWMEAPREKDKRILCLLCEKIDFCYFFNFLRLGLRDETKNSFGENNFASFSLQFWQIV